MCDPLSIAIGGSVMGMAGSAMQARAQNNYADKVAAAQTQAADAEHTRQMGYSRASEDAATAAQGGFTRQAQDQKLQEAQQTRGDKATAVISDQTPYEASETKPSIVNETMAKSIADALAKGKDSTKALANLSAFGDLGLANKIALNNSGQQINTQQNFARGSAALLPLEMTAAGARVKHPSNLGGMISMLGQGLSLYGAGGGAFGMGATPSASIYTPGSITVRDLPPL